VETSRESTGLTLVNTLSLAIKAASAVGGVVALLHSLDRGHGHSWLGPSPRRSPARAALPFGVGAVLGAAAALLVPPLARTHILRSLWGRSAKKQPGEQACADESPTNGSSVAAGTPGGPSSPKPSCASRPA
jgi:hypothetical protein